MTYRNFLLIFLFVFTLACSSWAQDSSRFYFTTAIGVFKPVAGFSKAYQNSLALNSGMEYRFSKHYFTQFVLELNSVKYNQQVRDVNSYYLFQQTSSLVFLAGLSLGRNFFIGKACTFFMSPYIGAGYASIGEPRLTIKDAGIIEQHIATMAGVYTKLGGKISYRTSSKILQTIYLDLACLRAGIKVQETTPEAFSVLVGTRFGF